MTGRLVEVTNTPMQRAVLRTAADRTHLRLKTGVSHLKVKYRNTLADIIRFNLFVLARQRPLQIFGVVASLFFGHTTWSSVRQLDAGIANKIVVFVVMLSAILGIIGAITFSFAILTVVSTRSRHDYGEHEVALDENGVVETNPFGRQETNWQGVYRIVRTRRMVMLFITPSSAHLVPSTAFGSPAELNQFLAYATQRASNAKV